MTIIIIIFIIIMIFLIIFELKAVDSHPRRMNGFLTGCLLQVMIMKIAKFFFFFFPLISMMMTLFRSCKRTSQTFLTSQSSWTIKCSLREGGIIAFTYLYLFLYLYLNLDNQILTKYLLNVEITMFIKKFKTKLYQWFLFKSRSRAHRGIECRAEFSHVGNIWNAPLLTHWTDIIQWEFMRRRYKKNDIGIFAIFGTHPYSPIEQISTNHCSALIGNAKLYKEIGILATFRTQPYSSIGQISTNHCSALIGNANLWWKAIKKLEYWQHLERTPTHPLNRYQPITVVHWTDIRTIICF